MPRLSEKLTLLPLALFMIGWGLFVTGFVWMLVTWSTNTRFSYTDYSSRTDPKLFPYYFTLVGGPFVVVLGCLHAMLKCSSSIFGALSAIMSVIYFVSAGTVTTDISEVLVGPLSEFKNHKVVLMLTGTLIEGLCWCFVLILSMFYEYPHLGSNYSRRGTRRPFTPGIARVLSIPCIVLSFLGWCVFIAGLYKGTDTTSCFIPFYLSSVFVIAPLLYLAALLHAGCSGGASTVMGVFTSVLNMIYLYLMGSFVTDAAIVLYECNHDPGCDVVDVSLRLLLGGGVVSLLFWGCVLALWPFYRKHPSTNDREDSAPPRNNQSNISEPPPTYGTVQHPTYYFDTRPLIGSS